MVQIVHGIMSIFIKGKNTSTVLNILIFLLVLAKFLECIFLKVNKNAFYFALRLFFFKKKSRGGKHFTFILEELGSEKPFTIEL